MVVRRPKQENTGVLLMLGRDLSASNMYFTEAFSGNSGMQV